MCSPRPVRAEFGHAGDFGDEADAARAVDAARHHRLDQRAEILVRHRALVLVVARMIHAVAKRLVLQVALAALVADRAVQRVVDQQELHHAAAARCAPSAVGLDDHALGDRMAQEAIGFGGVFSISTRHMRQLPAIDRRSW